MRFVKIVSTGTYLPERRVPNEALRPRFERPGKDNPIDKLEARTGILQRWYASEDMATSDLAAAAARVALARAGRDPSEVDLVVVATDSPDFITPSTSVVVQHALGARSAGAFDVCSGCASFPTALASCASLMATSAQLRTVVVIGAYLMHRLADPDDPISFLYGDGAGAVVLESGSRPGYLGVEMQADGAYARAWGMFSGGTAEPATVESVRAGRTRVRMVEKYPPEINLEGWPRLVRRLAASQGFEPGEVDHYIFTQVNRPTIEAVMAELDVPVERAPMIMDEVGYTGSACIPMALDRIVRAGRVETGDLVVMVGSGVGYSQAAVAVRM